MSFKPISQILIQEETNTQCTIIWSPIKKCLTMARNVAMCRNSYKYEIL